MIYILAGNYAAAKRWAEAQHLDNSEWFSTLDIDDLNAYENFHVIVLESASELAPGFFEKLFRKARQRGRMNARKEIQFK